MPNQAYKAVKDTNLLPSPTGVAMEILRLAGDDKTTLDQIGKVVQSDPALAARLLKLVNSPFAGVERKVASVTAAVKLLGLRTVRNLALGLSLVSNNREGRCEAFDYDAFWSISLARAVAARHLATCTKSFVPDEVFALGLLSKIGRLALATVRPREYAELLMRCAGGRSDNPLALEREIFGLNHNELTAEMMADWHLHPCFCDAVKNQDVSGREGAANISRADQFRQLLRVAGTIASVVAESEAQDEALARMAEETASTGVSQEMLDTLFDAIVKDWRETGCVFSVTTREVPSLEQLREYAQHLATSRIESHRVSPTSNVISQAEHALHILVVDDDPASMKLVERYLTGAGYRVTTATSAEEALEIDRREAPQIIVTDWVMPGMDGIELCHRLRADERMGWVFILVLTAMTEKGKELAALEAGADDFLGKPFTRQELLAHIRVGERVVRLESNLGERNRQIAHYNALLADANDRLRKQATTDEMTGLINRREAMTRLEQQWAMSQRYNEPLCCILADIDHFKSFNDTYGHALGDQVLRATAATLLKSSRTTDTVGRIGGEEFLIICPKSTAKMTRIAAERMRKAVAENPLIANGEECRITASFGLAERTPVMQNPPELLKAADEALYAAKQTGRNRVCGHDSSTAPA